MNTENLSKLSRAKSRSISVENPTGEKGKDGIANDPNHEYGDWEQELLRVAEILGIEAKVYSSPGR